MPKRGLVLKETTPTAKSYCGCISPWGRGARWENLYVNDITQKGINYPIEVYFSLIFCGEQGIYALLLFFYRIPYLTPHLYEYRVMNKEYRTLDSACSGFYILSVHFFHF